MLIGKIYQFGAAVLVMCGLGVFFLLRTSSDVIPSNQSGNAKKKSHTLAVEKEIETSAMSLRNSWEVNKNSIGLANSVPYFLNFHGEELLLEIEKIYGKYLNENPQLLFEALEDYEFSSREERVRTFTSFLATLISFNPRQAVDIVSRFSSGEMPSGAVGDLTQKLLEVHAIDQLNDLIKVEGKRSASEITSGISNIYQEREGPDGKFPSELLVSNSRIGRDAIELYLSSSGGPSNIVALESWIQGAQKLKGKNTLVQKSCELFGSKNHTIAVDYFQSNIEQLPIEASRGLLTGISNEDPSLASQLALESKVANVLIGKILPHWLEEDSFVAADWVAVMEQGEVRQNAIRATVRWLKRKSYTEQAKEWSALLNE